MYGISALWRMLNKTSNQVFAKIITNVFVNLN